MGSILNCFYDFAFTIFSFNGLFEEHCESDCCESCRDFTLSDIVWIIGKFYSLQDKHNFNASSSLLKQSSQAQNHLKDFVESSGESPFLFF